VARKRFSSLVNCQSVSLQRRERGAAEQSAGSDGRLTLFHSHSSLLSQTLLCVRQKLVIREKREKRGKEKRGVLLLLSTTLNRKSDSLTNPSSSIPVHPLSLSPF